MPLNAPHIQAAAATLADRRLKGLAGPCLQAELAPHTLEDALAIQWAVMGYMARAGYAVSGWKCGTPGPDKLVVAPIYAPTVHAASPCPVWAHDGEVRVEPELAFVIGRDLAARDEPYAPDEVDAAIVRTHLALELIDSRYSDPSTLSFADKLADGLVNQGLFIGPEVDAGQAALTHTMTIDIRVDGRPTQARAGQHPDPLPRLPLYWLAEYLRGAGQGLKAGQVVITGSYAGTFALPVGRAVAMRFGELGELAVEFAAKAR